MEYIDRQAAIEAACKGFCHPGVRCPDVECREQTKFIREIPAADVVPVVHGEWNRLDCDTFNCNKCGSTFIVLQGSTKMNYCPNCGAKMDGKRREE